MQKTILGALIANVQRFQSFTLPSFRCHIIKHGNKDFPNVPMLCLPMRKIHNTSYLRDVFTVQDEQDFKNKVLESQKPVIVQFHANWCGPCKLLSPRMEQALVKFQEKVDMAKVDIDELPDLAMNYSVMAVPSVLLFKEGKIADKFVGLKDEDEVSTFVSNAVS